MARLIFFLRHPTPPLRVRGAVHGGHVTCLPTPIVNLVCYYYASLTSPTCSFNDASPPHTKTLLAGVLRTTSITRRRPNQTFCKQLDHNLVILQKFRRNWAILKRQAECHKNFVYTYTDGTINPEKTTKLAASRLASHPTVSPNELCDVTETVCSIPAYVFVLIILSQLDTT